MQLNFYDNNIQIIVTLTCLWGERTFEIENSLWQTTRLRVFVNGIWKACENVWYNLNIWITTVHLIPDYYRYPPKKTSFYDFYTVLSVNQFNILCNSLISNRKSIGLLFSSVWVQIITLLQFVLLTQLISDYFDYLCCL